jgi:lysophospholipase L1-like esterase
MSYNRCESPLRRLVALRTLAKFGVFVAATSVAALAAQAPRPTPWITAWSTSQQVRGAAPITNTTIRMIARVTIPGDAVRIRLDNTFGVEPVSIGRAYVGYRIRGASLAAGSNRAVTFGGAPTVVIPPAGTAWSDPVSMKVLAQQDLAVSVYVPDSDVRPSQHTAAVVTSYRAADGHGDAASTEAGDSFTETTTAMWWLKAIDVQSTTAAGSIVAFGDSITDGTCSTLDAHDRWEDVLAVRLSLAQERVKAVLNEGIGGNTVMREGLTPPPDSPPGTERLDRDVLSHHGVTDVIVFMGTNDIRRGATAASVIASLTSLIKRIKAERIHTTGVTIIPRHNVSPAGTNTGWDPEKTRIRNEVNQWIRAKAPFDDVLDFDRIVRNSTDADLMSPPFNCGDGIHPSPIGYFEMGKSIDLRLFGPRRQ